MSLFVLSPFNISGQIDHMEIELVILAVKRVLINQQMIPSSNLNNFVTSTSKVRFQKRKLLLVFNKKIPILGTTITISSELHQLCKNWKKLTTSTLKEVWPGCCFFFARIFWTFVQNCSKNFGHFKFNSAHLILWSQVNFAKIYRLT